MGGGKKIKIRKIYFLQTEVVESNFIIKGKLATVVFYDLPHVAENLLSVPCKLRVTRGPENAKDLNLEATQGDV